MFDPGRHLFCNKLQNLSTPFFWKWMLLSRNWQSTDVRLVSLRRRYLQTSLRRLRPDSQGSVALKIRVSSILRSNLSPPGKTLESLKMAKQDAETALLDLDDGNASGRSSDCYDGNFGCSPSSATRLPPVSSASPPESTVGTAARLEHLVMAIEQIEGPPGNTPPQLEKPPPLSGSFAYAPHGQTVYYKFPDSASDLRPFSYSLNTTDSGVLKQNINSFAEEFVLNSSPPALPPTLIPACEDKSTKEISMDGYHPVAKLLNRPIPHKYLHRPQVVVNNSH